MPSNPAAWLTTVARRIAIDRLRRRRIADRARERLEHEHRLAPPGACYRSPDDPYELLGRWPDERLRLIFLCCHRSLDVVARQALTLREVCGLSTVEVASAFLTSEQAMAQRLVRAKRRLRDDEARLELPEPEEFEDRLVDVLRVIYLLFNEGYLVHGGTTLMRADLCDHAIWLVRMVDGLLAGLGRGEHPEALGLTALLMLLHSRRHARVSPDGLPVLLEEQDRSRWVREEADEALALLDRAVALRSPGPYQLMAAINAVHFTADNAKDTDWAAIAALYRRLVEFEPTQVVRLNAAVASGLAEGPASALAALEELEREPGFRLGAYASYHLARARFLADSGAAAAAEDALRAALAVSDNEAERRFIRGRLARS